MTTVTTIREHAGDILADAKELNGQRTETLEPVPNHTGRQVHTRSPLLSTAQASIVECHPTAVGKHYSGSGFLTLYF